MNMEMTNKASMRRRMLVGAAILLIVLAVGVVLGVGLRGEQKSEADPASVSLSSSAASPSAEWPTDAVDKGSQVSKDVITAWITENQNLNVWRSHISPFATESFQKKLAYTDPRFTGGEVTGVALDSVKSETEAIYRVDTSTDFVYVVTAQRDSKNDVLVSAVTTGPLSTDL